MERYQVFENTSSFCPEIEKTCCTKQDFTALANWWQTNTVEGSTCSRQAIRQNNTHSIIYYTKMILKKFDNYKHLANIIVKSNGSSEFCQKAATNFLGNFNNSKLTDKKFLNEYFAKQSSCFELTNKLQLNVICGLCDSTWNNTVDFATGKIRLNKTACSDISNKCRDTISSNLNVIYPFVRYLEPLLRCSTDGDYDTNLKKIRFSSKSAIDHAIKDELTIQQCEKAVTFGVKMNYNSEGNPNFLRKLYRRAKRFFDLIEVDRRAEQQSEINAFMDRRRLKVKNSKKNLDELFDALTKKKLLKILSNGSQDDEEDFVNNKNWYANLIKHIKTKEDGGFKFGGWLEYKVKDMKYPYKTNAFEEFLGLCKFELKGYFERNYVLLLLSEEKNKILKVFKDLKYDTFKKQYGCSRFVGKFITTIESLHNEHINYTDQLKKIIRNYPCPKSNKLFENMMTLFNESIESVYTFKRRTLVMSNEKYKIENYLSNLDFAKFKLAYKKKSSFVKELAKTIAKFSFKQGNLLQLEESLTDRLLNKRSYPDDAEEFQALIDFINEAVVSYFNLKSKELNHNYHQNVVVGYLTSMDYNKFKKEFKEEKTFIEDIYNEIQSQMALSDNEVANNLSNIVKYRLSYFRYPNTLIKWKAFKKEWLKIIDNYFDRMKLDLNLVYDKTMASIYSKNVDIEQFQNSYETEDYHVSLANSIKKYFEKNDASDLKETLQKTFKKMDYPKNNTNLNAIKDILKEKLDSFFKLTEDVMLNEYCRKDLLDGFESMDYVDLKYKFNGHKSTFGDQLLESIQKYCGVYNRNKKELLLKISNELKYPTDEEDFYQMIAKIKKRIKDVYNSSGRRLVNLLLNQLKLGESQEKEQLKIITARQRVLTQSKLLTKENKFNRLVKINQKIERILQLGKKDDFVHLDTKPVAKNDNKVKLHKDEWLYKKEELSEIKQMPRQNSARDSPRSVKSEESEDDEDETDKKSEKGDEVKVKRSECLDEIEDEVTNYTRKKFEDENPNSDDVQAIFSSFVAKISGCGNWLKKESTIEDELQKIKLTMPTYKKGLTSTEKDTLFNEKIKQPLIDAKEKYVKKEGDEKKTIRRMMATDKKLTKDTEDKFHFHDDYRFIAEGISKTGRIAYFAKTSLKSEENKNAKLMRILKKTNRKVLPKKELDMIRKLAKENKEECKENLKVSVRNLDIGTWRTLRKNCDTSDCVIIKFLDSQRKQCNGYLRSIRELRYVTPDLEIVYSSSKYNEDKKKNQVLNSKVKKVLIDQVERFLCDERVRKDGSLLKDSQEVKIRDLEMMKKQYERNHLKIRLLLEEVNDKDSCGKQLKLELDELTEAKLENYLDEPKKGDSECDLIDAVGRWINEQRCDCNGFMEPLDKIKELLKNNEKLKKPKLECNDSKDSDKKLKKLLGKVKEQLKLTAEQYGNDKAQNRTGGAYEAPKDGALCESDERRRANLTTSRKLDTDENGKEKKTSEPKKNDAPKRQLDTDENGKEKKTSEPKKKDAPKRQLDTDENGKEKKTSEPKKNDAPKRRLKSSRNLSSVNISDYEPYNLKSEASLEFEFLDNSKVRNIVEGFGWHGFKSIELKKEKLMKLSHNSLRYTCRRQLQMIETSSDIKSSTASLVRFWVIGMAILAAFF